MLLQRLVRRFGADRLIAKVPAEDQRLIKNLRKVRTRVMEWDLAGVFVVDLFFA